VSDWLPSWTADTWAQVSAAVAAMLAAIFAWRSARASARAGALIVLTAEYRRLDEIRRIILFWNGAGDDWRRNAQTHLRRLLRRTDDLPRTRELARADNVTVTFDDHGNALLELDTALTRVEERLKG
jgi:hypothetical protein